MLTYEVDGRVLTLVVRGANNTLEERQQVTRAILTDPKVPSSALVLLDVRRSDPWASLEEIDQRARVMIDLLGRKMGPACAVIVPPRLLPEAERFQDVMSRLGLDVQLFRDEPEARAWLRKYE